MARTPHRLMNALFLLNIAVISVVLTACAGEHSASKADREKTAARPDDRGTKALVYATDRKEHTTSRNPRPTLKERAAAQDKAEQTRAKQAAQLELLSDAPKRQSQDPIYVNLAPPVLDGKMQQAEKPKGAVTQQIRDEFTSDPVIKLVNGNRSVTKRQAPGAAPSIADVDVFPKVSIKEIYGVNYHTGKPAKMVAVVFEAIITSQTPPATYTVSETGQVLENAEVSKRFTRQVRQIIVEKIGPRIPAH